MQQLPSFAQAQAQTTTSALDQTAQQIVETQQTTTQFLTNDLKAQGPLQFNIRWSPVTTLEPDSMNAVFADCNPGEFAVSSMYMFENENVEAVQSFPIAIPDDLMTWLTVLNNDGPEAQQVATGVVCVDGDGNNAGKVNLDASTKLTIQNTVNRLVQEGDILGGGDTTTNISYITKIYQSIVQKAIQIVNVSGNNNTVNQIINQSASQIVESGGANVNQTIDQNAAQIIGTNATAITTPTTTTGPEEDETTSPPPTTNTTARTTIVEEDATTPETETEEEEEEEPEVFGPTNPPPTEETTEEDTEPEPEEDADADADAEPEGEDPSTTMEDVEITDGELTDDNDNTPDGA